MLNLPIVRMLRHHNEDRLHAESEKQAVLEHQHDLSRRVHVIEWQTFPRTHKDENDDAH